jgi:P4 family phage/plasmid primase-like protien
MKYDALTLKRMGYPVLPVTPPDGKISPLSKLNPTQMGKAPGELTEYGWSGLVDWSRLRFTAEKIMEWKCNTGVLLGDVVVVDLDIRDETVSNAVLAMAIEVMGVAPIRIGEWPKQSLIYQRNGAVLPNQQTAFKVDGTKHLVEILSKGKQAVFAGMHRCGKEYDFPNGLPDMKDLPKLSYEKVTAFIARMEETFHDMGMPVVHSSAGNREPKNVDQSKLIGDETLLRKAMSFLPNTAETYPFRPSYVKMGIALKAATVGFEDVGWELYLAWAIVWPGATEENIRKDWDSFHPPYECGAGWIYDECKPHGYNEAAEEFEPLALEAPPDPEGKPAILYSDIWMADEFVEAHQDVIRRVTGRDKDSWYSYTGRVWTPQQSAVLGLAVEFCKGVSDKVLRSSEASDKAKKQAVQLAHKLLSARMVTSIPTLARSNQRVVKTHESEFDMLPDLLNTPGGILDLRSGSIVAPDSKYMISLQTSIDPDYAPPQRWLRFLEEATGERDTLVTFLQRLAGYCLTGHVSEQCFCFFHGSGGNGKGVFLNTLAAILGGYARTASTGVFLASNQERHPTELASLMGARMVLAQELRQGQQWDEARLKMVTGGDTITARFMRQDEFNYVPTFKVLMSGNNRPSFQSVDAAMTRRVRLVPFTQTPKVVDTKLTETLRGEHARIFGWMLAGARQWYEQGLQAPPIVLEATKSYLDEEDVIGMWLEERCLRGPDEEVRATAAYDDWSIWCGVNGSRPGSLVTFGRKLSDLGFTKRRDEVGTLWQCLGLKPG